MSLSNQAYEIIRRDIITCVLMPGQQIVQAQLVEKYGLGITPVREALQRLSHEGLVTTVPRTGYIVSPITLATVRELFEFRLILETAAARIAIERATDEQLARIAEQAEYSIQPGDQLAYLRAVTLNHDFHCAIAQASGNSRLAECLAHTLDNLTRVFYLIIEVPDHAQESHQEHLSLVHALQTRNSELAVAAIHAQISHSARLVAEVVARNISGTTHLSTGADPGKTILW